MASLLRWRQPSWLRWRLLLGITLLVIVDVWMHRRRLAIARPASNLDPSFLLGCQESDFEAAVTEAAAKDGSVARVGFETISPEMWRYPDWIDRTKTGAGCSSCRTEGSGVPVMRAIITCAASHRTSSTITRLGETTSGTGVLTPTSPFPASSHTIPLSGWSVGASVTATPWPFGRARRRLRLSPTSYRATRRRDDSSVRRCGRP